MSSPLSGTEFEGIIQSSIARAADNARQEFGVQIPDGVLSFLSIVFSESLQIRRDDWARFAVPIRFPEDLANILPGMLDDLFRGTVSTAGEREGVPVGQVNVLSVIDIIEYSHNNWCRVFPICRSS